MASKASIVREKSSKRARAVLGTAMFFALSVFLSGREAITISLGMLRGNEKAHKCEAFPVGDENCRSFLPLWIIKISFNFPHFFILGDRLGIEGTAQYPPRRCP